MKYLVNHNGTVQYKWIVATQEELFEYIEQIASKRIAKRIGNWLEHPKSDPQMEQLYHIKRVGALQLGAILTADLWESAQKQVRQGETLVFNEAGGYCTWDDETMKLLDWEFLLEPKDVIVLENGKNLEPDVSSWLKKAQIQEYLFLNLEGRTKEEILYYCSKASIIAFQTQAVDAAQIEILLKFATLLEPKSIIVVNSPRFPAHREELTKHNVVVIEEEYEKPKNS